MEHELSPLSTASWTDAQQDPCTLAVTQGFAEHTSLPLDRENWEEKDFADPIDSMDVAALLDRAADRSCACSDTKVESMMDRFEKRIDERIDSKLGPVMDRLTALEKTNSSTKSGHTLRLTMVDVLDTMLAVAAHRPRFSLPLFLEIKGWCGFRDKNTHGLTEAQATEIIFSSCDKEIDSIWTLSQRAWAL